MCDAGRDQRGQDAALSDDESGETPHSGRRIKRDPKLEFLGEETGLMSRSIIAERQQFYSEVSVRDSSALDKADYNLR